MKTVVYKPHIVTYLDILGFQEIIKSKSAGYVSRLIRIVQDATRPSDWAAKGQDIRYQNFSDLCVVATPIKGRTQRFQSQGIFFLELIGLVHAQVKLLSEDVFLRGAVTIGPLVKSYNVLYGPGLVTAYHLEQKAEYPRIVVDPNALEMVRKDSIFWVHDQADDLEAIEKLLYTDESGVTYIDYLRAIERECDDPINEYTRFLNLHKRLIRSNLAKFSDDPRIYAKYQWLSQYHDEVVSERMSSEDRAKYLISDSSVE